MQTITTLAAPSTDAALVTSLLAAPSDSAPPAFDGCERLLDRYAPSPAYFERSASAAEIARVRGTGRLTYDAV